MLITVTSKHIREGRKDPDGVGRSRSCPIARALKEQLGRVFLVHLDILRDEDNDLQVVAPVRVQRFVRKFDRTNKGKPFRFKLEV